MRVAPSLAQTVELYPMPESHEAPLLEALQGAQRSVDVSCYLIQDPHILNALCAAARRGVHVRVMTEPAASPHADFERIQQRLQAAGVEVKTPPPRFDDAHFVDHAKFVCVDDKELLLGSGNLVESGLGGSRLGTNRDFWLEDCRTESVHEAGTLFDADWARQDTQGLTFNNLVVSPENAQTRLFALMDGAHQRLWVYNQELEDPAVVDRLIAAKQRGVDVRVLVAAPLPREHRDPNASAVTRLRSAGVDVRELGFYRLHAKALVADSTSFIGSQNFTHAGLTENRELGDVTDDPRFTSQLAAVFQRDAYRIP
jgi:phosphatidylserine/phosphatidylglycerophosphate/cardiolipin synthase-like enzyme